VCYLCHKYCLTYSDITDFSCLSCSSSFFKWQQASYGNRCNYFCSEGSYAANSTVGEFITPINSSSSRTCSVCAPGCKYCSSSASNCYICQDDYFLIDDMAFCRAIFRCKLCQTVVSGGVVTDGCQSFDKICRFNSCPIYFYFPLYTASNGGVNDSLATNSKYNYFTYAALLNTSENGYEWNTTRASFSSQTSPSDNSQIYYRRLTNFCGLCDFRCLKCSGPSNWNCSQCVNLYYKWTNASVCESFCPEGQFQLISSSYPDN